MHHDSGDTTESNGRRREPPQDNLSARRGTSAPCDNCERHGGVYTRGLVGGASGGGIMLNLCDPCFENPDLGHRPDRPTRYLRERRP